MTKRPPKRKTHYGSYAAGIIALIVVVALIAQNYNSSNTTPPTSTPPSTPAILLRPEDFSLSSRVGCVYTNPPPYESFIVYYLYVTNRYNSVLTYVNGSLSGTMTLSNHTSIPFPTQHVAPSPKGQWNVAIPTSGPMFARGTFVSAKLELRLQFKEVNTPITFAFTPTYEAGNYPTCPPS